MKTDSTRRIRIENRAPHAGKTRLRLTVGGTRRAATGTPACTNRTPGAPSVTACAPCRWPTPHFSCDHDGLLRRFSTRPRRVAEKVREQSGLSERHDERKGRKERTSQAMAGKPRTIDDYLATVSDDQRAALEQLRKTIRIAAP